jgi:hypothetical protein
MLVGEGREDAAADAEVGSAHVNALLGVVKTKGEFSKVVRVHEAAFAPPLLCSLPIEIRIPVSLNLSARFIRMNLHRGAAECLNRSMGPGPAFRLGFRPHELGVEFGRTRARHLASSRLRVTAWNLQDNLDVLAHDRSGGEAPAMSSRFVAIDEGPDIALDRAMIVVGRDPNCDARLDSLRVSRHHCCMACKDDQVVVRDLGSTNGIRINGMRVETGSLRPGDELSIADVRYRFEGEDDFEQASDPAIREQDSAPDSNRRSNRIHSPKWGFSPMHKG